VFLRSNVEESFSFFIILFGILILMLFEFSERREHRASEGYEYAEGKEF
jgi:hypothetical protein